MPDIPQRLAPINSVIMVANGFKFTLVPTILGVRKLFSINWNSGMPDTYSIFTSPYIILKIQDYNCTSNLKENAKNKTDREKSEVYLR